MSQQNSDSKVLEHVDQSGSGATSTLSLSSNELNYLRCSLENSQRKLLQDFDKRMSNMIDNIIQDIRQNELRTHEFGKFTNETNKQHEHLKIWNNRDKVPHEKVSNTKLDTNQSANNATADNVDNVYNTAVGSSNRRFPHKMFTTRESYLTALLEVAHMKTIYHIFHIILIIFLMNAISSDYVTEGRVNFGLGTFKAGLQRLHWVFLVWLIEHIFVFTLYYAFCGWAKVRAKLDRQIGLQRFWSHSCLILYISSQLVFGYVAFTLCLRFNLPFVSASVLLLESTRLLMKMHAFVRTNAARVIAGKQKSEDDGNDEGNKKHRRQKLILPKFSWYLYYLFAPTLIYRDAYPRTRQIRWKFAITRLLEVVAIAFLYSFIHERHIHLQLGNFGREEMNASKLIMKFFGLMLPSVVIFLCGFYMILHSWLNFTAELLRFGDRMFYKDWWTVHTYDAYYRNWNVVVHDWLYEFIYKDFYTYIFKGSKSAASLMVFMVSAIVHEMILGFALQMFFPVMFLSFGGLGVLLFFVMRRAPKNFGNTLLWFTLIFGNTVLVSSYSMEYYARKNCPSTQSTNWLDSLMPVSWTCYNTNLTVSY